MSFWARVAGSTLSALACLTFATAKAQPVEDFYRHRQMQLIIGQPVGGAYDSYARLLASFIGKYLPGEPVIVPQTMDGASSLNATNYIANTAPRDGSVFGTGQRAVLLMPLLDMQGTRFDPQKLTYLGSMSSDIAVCLAWHDSGFHSIEDMRKRDIIMGTSGSGAEINDLYSLVSLATGAKIKLVRGYRGGESQDLAMERGELDGRCGVSYATLLSGHEDWVQTHKIDILLQLGLTKSEKLPDVPLVLDLVNTERDKEAMELLLSPSALARPFFAPPGVPADRTVALRTAFDRAVRDPELIARAQAQRLEVNPIAGGTMQQMIDNLYKTPPAAVERAKALIAD